ncbi:MAG: response regulator [Flavobacterium sp.]|nr:response regulator [Pedobacter sp.]
MKNPKVLIVDDDDIIVFLHTLIVKDSGLCSLPLPFKNGQTAYNFILEQDNKNQYLIFLDLNMPVMDGWQFLDLIENSSLHISVIIVSASIDPEDLKKARGYSKVTQFVEKPLNLKVCGELLIGYN